MTEKQAKEIMSFGRAMVDNKVNSSGNHYRGWLNGKEIIGKSDIFYQVLFYVYRVQNWLENGERQAEDIDVGYYNEFEFVKEKLAQ